MNKWSRKGLGVAECAMSTMWKLDCENEMDDCEHEMDDCENEMDDWESKNELEMCVI